MIKTSKKISRSSSALLMMIAVSLIIYFFIIRPQQQYYYAHSVQIHGIFFLKPVHVNNFTLTDQHDNPFTQDNLKNHWSLIFFGFTHCSTVCPVVLSALNKMYLLLEKQLPQNLLPQVVFITIDPEGDSITRLKNYLRSFNSNFIGARTTTEKTAEIEKSFFVTATKITKPEQNQYTFDHSSEIILMNPDAKIQAYFSYPPQAEQLAADYYAVLAELLATH